MSPILVFFQDKISQVHKRIKTSSGFLYQMSPESRFRVIHIHIYLPKGDSQKILP